MGVDAKTCLTAALKDLGVRRLRLMSYWNEHEKVQGKYDFTELDWQIDMAEKYESAVTLCIGLRQPRWPESHWPAWAKRMPKEEWNGALYKYITAVVERYKDRKCIVSYQLENEALLKTFGADGDFDRKRLKYEFRLVKKLDPIRPVIMTTSNSWGIPFFGPRPDAYAFSLYRYVYHHGSHHHSSRKPWFYRLRAWAIMLLKWRVCFIHELQAEPWGPVATVRMQLGEQYKSMNRQRVQDAVRFAAATGLAPIDIWGLEWWYWLKQEKNQPEIWNDMKEVFGPDESMVK